VRSVVRALAVTAAVVLIGLTALLATLAVKRASLPYENGRHFDVVYSVVYDESAITVYGLLALGSAAISAVLVFRTLRLWKRR
jgi:hypothetical protein